MISSGRSPLFFFPILLWSLFQAGCAARLPSTLPIGENQRESILAHYRSFRSEECASPIDADIYLKLHSFGKHLKAEGYLQIQPPSLLRTTIVDKMGRPLFILVAAGDSLTLVNSMKGEALIGTVFSLTRESDCPIDLQTEEVVSLLTGRFAPVVSFLLDVRRDKQTGALAWLTFSSRDDKRHNILFDPGSERVMRHVINSGSGDILLDIQYIRQEEEKEACTLPDELAMTGAALGGEVTLKYGLVMRPQEIQKGTFELDLPAHYFIKRTE